MTCCICWLISNKELQFTSTQSSRQLELLLSIMLCERLFLFVFLKISTMREDEKVLRQKLADVEKAKKQLQSDLTNRDRTIQQLKVVR